MVCRNAVAFGPPVHRARRDAEDQFARRRVGRACSNTSCPFPARSPGRDAAGMRGATGDRGARRAGRPASTGRRPPGLPADTVRGWLRRARRRAPSLRVLATGVAYRADPILGPIPPRRSVLADAVEALG